MRSVYLQPNKAVFNVRALPLSEYADSLGLASAPVVKMPAEGVSEQAERADTHAKKLVGVCCVLCLCAYFVDMLR